MVILKKHPRKQNSKSKVKYTMSRNKPTEQEKQALTIVRQLLPNIEFELKDSPDIQAKDKSIGIEVVDGVSEEVERYLNTKNRAVIENLFLDSKYFLGKQTIAFTTQYSKKLKKLNNGNYDGYKKYGLMIFSPIPKLDMEKEKWFKYSLEDITKSEKRHFDFIIVAPRCYNLYNQNPLNHVWFIAVSSRGNIKNTTNLVWL